jgi:tape measure domain-containing protein
MSQTIHKLKAVFTSNVASFTAGLNNAIAVTKQLGAQWGQTAQAIDTAATRVATVVTGVTAGIGTGLVAMGFQFQATQDKALISFETLLKSADKAKQLNKELLKLGAETPFEFSGLSKSAVKIVAFEKDIGGIIRTIKALGNATSALGKGQEELDGMARALQQISAKGKASTEELLQLSERGLPAIEIIAARLGVTIAEAYKEVEKGAVDSVTAISAIVEYSEREYAGAMERASQTVEGRFSTLKDNLAIAAGTITQPLFAAVNTFLADLNNKMGAGGFEGIVTRLTGKAKELADQLRSFSEANLGDGVQLFTDYMESAVDVVVDLTGYLKENGPAILEYAQAWGEVVGQVVKFLAENPRLVEALLIFKVGQLSGVNGIIGAIATAIFTLGDNSAGTAGKLKTMVTQLVASRAAALALVTAIGLVAGAYAAEFNPMVQEFYRQQEKGRVADVQQQYALRSRLNKEREGVVSNGTAEAAQKRVAQLEKEVAGAEASLQGAQKRVEELDTTFNSLIGDRILEEAKTEVTSLSASLEVFKQALEDAKKDSAALGQVTKATQADDAGSTESDEKKAKTEAARQRAAIDGAIKQKELSNVDPNTRSITDFASLGGATAKDVEKFASQFDGLDEFYAKKIGEAFELYGTGEDFQRFIGDTFAEIGNQEAKQRELVKQQQEQASRESFLSSTPESIRSAEDSFTASYGEDLAAEGATQLASAFQAIDKAVMDGTMTIEQGNAARQREIGQIEKGIQRQAILNARTPEQVLKAQGKSFQELVQDRVAQMKTAQVDQLVSRSAEGLARAMGLVTDGFERVNTGIQGFNQELGKSIDPQRAAEAWGTLNTFLSSMEGRQTQIANNISLLQQKLSIVETYSQRQAIQDQIDALYEASANLAASQAEPMFYQQPNVTQNISINGVNLSPTQLTNTVVTELERQGKKLWT